MKTVIPCMKCLGQFNFPKTLILKEIPDNGIFHLRCEQGHETVTLLQQQKFELLFDLGLSALCDGYPREAITNFAASLERFYEFYIRFYCLKHNIDWEQLEKCWGIVRKQSERQYGAYVFLYMLEHPNSDFPFIEEKRPSKGMKPWKEFRNGVVHNGDFISEREAFEYGELVYDFLSEQVNELLKNDGENISKTVSYCLQSTHSRAMKENPCLNSIGALCMPTVISLSSGLKQKSFKDAYEEFRNNSLRKILQDENQIAEMQASMNTLAQNLGMNKKKED